MKARLPESEDKFVSSKPKTKNSVNVFMEQIYNKVPKPINKSIFSEDRKKWLEHCNKINEFKRTVLEGSPSFNLLWDMADFIKLAEMVFFYKNDVDSATGIGLYSSRNYQQNENGMIITNPNVKIVIKLNANYEKVSVEVTRTPSNENTEIKPRSFNLSFSNGVWSKDPTLYDEMLLEQVIKILTEEIIALFDWCYEQR